MGNRSALKFLKQFSEEEFYEKKAEEVYVKRVKMESSMRWGQFPSTRVKKIEGTHFLVCVIHNNRMRVYFFSKNAQMMGAEDYEGEEKAQIWEKIDKKTKTVFHFSNNED